MHASFESTAFGALSAVRHEPSLSPRQDPQPYAHKAAEDGSWRPQVMGLLKDSLIKELLCVVRYNHLAADNSPQPLLSAEFLLHAKEELAHAYKLAHHIVDLGGELEYSPELLMRMGRATYDRHQDLKSMIAAHLNSQYEVIVRYHEVMSRIDVHDLPIRHLLERIVKDERDHAEELRSWLID